MPVPSWALRLRPSPVPVCRVRAAAARGRADADDGPGPRARGRALLLGLAAGLVWPRSFPGRFGCGPSPCPCAAAAARGRADAPAPGPGGGPCWQPGQGSRIQDPGRSRRCRLPGRRFWPGYAAGLVRSNGPEGSLSRIPVAWLRGPFARPRLRLRIGRRCYQVKVCIMRDAADAWPEHTFDNATALHVLGKSVEVFDGTGRMWRTVWDPFDGEIQVNIERAVPSPVPQDRPSPLS